MMKQILRGLLLLATVAVTTGFLDLMELGFINGTSQSVSLLLEYNNGRRIDYNLGPRESLLNRRLLGERLLKVKVSGVGASYVCDVERLQKDAGKKQTWLLIGPDDCRLISAEQKRKLQER